MLTEKDLLQDIIECSPEGSRWLMSNDSWIMLPSIIVGLKTVDDIYEWEVSIKNENKKAIVYYIEKYELYDKIVHQMIVYNNEIIFKSYDHLIISFLSRKIHGYDIILNKYKNEEFSVCELT